MDAYNYKTLFDRILQLYEHLYLGILAIIRVDISIHE